MSIETEPNLTTEQESAMELINGSELLKNDEYSRRVVMSGGRTDSGQEVDLGNFLSARQAVVESARVAAKVRAAMDKDHTAWEVANSVSPDVERYVEN